MKKRKPREKRTYGFVWFLLLAVLLLFVRLLEVSMFARQIASVSLYYLWFYGMALLFEKLSHAAAKRAGEAAAPEKGVKTKTVLGVAYVTVQAAILLLLISNQFTGTISTRVYYDGLNSTMHIFLSGISAAACLGAAALIERKEKRAAAETAAGLLKSLGAVCGVTAVFLLIYTVLGVQCLTVLSWVVRVYVALTALSLLAGLALSVVKKQILTDFNYPTLFAFLRRARKKSFVELLEESTGLSVKSLYSVAYVGRILPGVVLGLLGVVLACTCFYKVDAYEQALVYRFGHIEGNSAVQPGLHLKLPWPVDKAEIYDVKRVREVSVGYEDSVSADNLWTQNHAGEEYKLLLGDGNELVSINMKLTYTVTDLYKFRTVFSDPEAVLSAKAYEMVMSKTINTDLTTLLSVDRSSFAETVRAALNAFCAEAGLGITVDGVILESIHPPVDIAYVYQNVVSAGVLKTTLRTNAEAGAAETIAGAEQEAKTAVLAAETDRTARVADAEAELEEFLAAAEQYRLHPDAMALAKYLDTFTTVVKDRKVYVFIGKTDTDNFIIDRASTHAVSAAIPDMKGDAQE